MTAPAKLRHNKELYAPIARLSPFITASMHEKMAMPSVAMVKASAGLARDLVAVMFSG